MVSCQFTYFVRPGRIRLMLILVQSMLRSFGECYWLTPRQLLGLEVVDTHPGGCSYKREAYIHVLKSVQCILKSFGECYWPIKRQLFGHEVLGIGGVRGKEQRRIQIFMYCESRRI